MLSCRPTGPANCTRASRVFRVEGALIASLCAAKFDPGYLPVAMPCVRGSIFRGKNIASLAWKRFLTPLLLNQILEGFDSAVPHEARPFEG